VRWQFDDKNKITLTLGRSENRARVRAVKREMNRVRDALCGFESVTVELIDKRFLTGIPTGGATSIDGFGGFLICEVVMRLKSLGTTKPKPNVTVHKENP